MNFITALIFNCMLNAMHQASSYEIQPGWVFTKTSSTSKKNLTKYLKILLKNSSEEIIDPRLLSLAWIESRLRLTVKRGDQGRACGVYQIHARYSYPMFRRKRGFVGWQERLNRRSISSECLKLENLSYSIKTMQKFLYEMDKRDLPPCHHNSGFNGKCNTWYKDRLNYWILYFSIANKLCYKTESN